MRGLLNGVKSMKEYPLAITREETFQEAYYQAMLEELQAIRKLLTAQEVEEKEVTKDVSEGERGSRRKR